MSDVASRTPAPRPEDDVEMSFFEHVAELRKRLLHALLGMVPAVAVSWFFKERLLAFLLRPWVLAWERRGLGPPRIHFAHPVEPFVAYLKIALVAGFLFASPWVFWQLWKFVAPGLYRHEKRLAVPFVLGASVCFVGGAFFGYEVIFPFAFETFLGLAGKLPGGELSLEATIMVGEYLSFATRMLLAFGVVFEIPVVVVLLSALGLVTWRRLLAFGRWWVLVAAVLSAILTPPDVGSQLLMIGPLVFLYYLSVGLAAVFGPKSA